MAEDDDELRRFVARAVEDAGAARVLAAAAHAEVGDLGVKVDALRRAINGLGQQTASRFDRMDERFGRIDARFEGLDARVDRLETKVDTGFAEMRAKFDVVDDGFAEMRAKFDQTAAGMEHIAGLITTLIDRGTPAD